MQVLVISKEQLFLDGLVALLGSSADVQAGHSARECVRAASMRDDLAVVADARSMDERDIDYLVGAHEFGGFELLFLIDKDQSPPQGIDNYISTEATGSELIARILGSRTPKVHEPRSLRVKPEAAKSVSSADAQKRRQGRPATVTNSLPLSSRQYELAVLVGEGKTNSQIAEIMGLREQTVRNVVMTVYKKLGCGNRKLLAEQMRSFSTK